MTRHMHVHLTACTMVSVLFDEASPLTTRLDAVAMVNC